MTEDAGKGETDSAETGRRDFLKGAAVGAGAAAVAGALHGKYGSAPLVAQAHAQGMPQLTERPWWPSKWGPGDEAGSTNHMTPAKALEAARLIRDGKVYRLGRVYEQGMPLFGQRGFALRIPGAPTGGPFGSNKLVYNDEFLATEVGQVGTQFDGLGHIGIQMGADGDKKEMRFYNGFSAQEVNGAYGLQKLGVDKLKPIFTRGHLLDIHAVRGRMLDAGEEVTLADCRAALAKQGMKEDDIKPGDAILFNTGWGSLWMKNNDRFNGGEPGIGLEVARWIGEKDLGLTGADTWGTEVVPNPDKNLAFPVHGELIAKRGIVNQENLSFDELIRDGKYQFAYVFSPAPIKGATGSIGSPLAIT
ncbi:MAG: cyclase family protein [Alphaproteobacteria bacterium]|nr:cyclase family protein [Alphaproteobacteria bacterium]